MEYRLNAEEWLRLRPEERGRRCRLWAKEAHDLAQNAPLHLKQTYFEIAQQWTRLAQEIEHYSGAG